MRQQPMPRLPLSRSRRRLSAMTVLLASGLTAATTAQAAEIRVGYPVVETLVRKALFVQENRYYLDGDPSQRCRYVYLESPRVGADGGRLTLRMHLSAQAGVEIRGRCMGPADSMEVLVSGVPTVRGNEVFLSDLIVDAPGRSYLGQLTAFAEQDLAQRLRLSFRPEVEAALVQASTLFATRLTLEQLTIRSATLDAQGVRLSFDFSLALGP
ncbi:MAG TPA: hypothetical protein VJU18_12170 [Vicinamibacteria bacterium]|nr:hypothetical protein [Vicinamibacteria bacterium]